MKIKFKRIHSDAVIPKFMTPGAACVDLVATHISIVGFGKVFVKLGFSTEIPEGWKICIAPRSSFTHQGWVMQNSPGQVDSDYRGEWGLKFEAIPVGINSFTGTTMKYEDFPYKKGDRIAQAWIEPVHHMEFEEVEDLSQTKRGEGGFGSTGK